MTFLPIAERELIVAARRPVTFRVRRGSALLASLVALLVLMFGGMFGGSQGVGGALFNALSVGTFVFVLGAGIFLTADSIGSERREGTLGLLFLTDLGGFDVIAGKFLAGGVNAFYGVLAVLPVMATAWFLGGVTGAEFWRTALVLLNTLLLSLSVGLWVSTVARSETESYGLTAMWLGGMTLVPLGIGWGLAMLASGTAAPPAVPSAITVLSPLGGFLGSRDLAYRAYAPQFWSSLAIVHLLAWAFLAHGSWRLRQGWRETGDSPMAMASPAAADTAVGGSEVTPPAPDELDLRRGWRTAGTAQPAVTSQRSGSAVSAPEHQIGPAPAELVLRRQRRDLNPVMSFVEGDLRVGRLAWICAIIGVGGLGSLVAAIPGAVGAFSPYLATGLLHLAWLPLKIVFAWKACQFFAVGRRDGTLELLLTTPASDFEIIRGQLLGLRQLFTKPVLALALGLALAWSGSLLSRLDSGYLGSVAGLGVVLALGLFEWFTLLLDLHTLAWMGFWFALVEPRPGVAFTKTIVRVVLLPLVLFCLPNLFINGLQLNWARDRFRMNLKSILQGSRDPWPVM